MSLVNNFLKFFKQENFRITTIQFRIRIKSIISKTFVAPILDNSYFLFILENVKEHYSKTHFVKKSDSPISITS